MFQCKLGLTMEPFALSLSPHTRTHTCNTFHVTTQLKLNPLRALISPSSNATING